MVKQHYYMGMSFHYQLPKAPRPGDILYFEGEVLSDIDWFSFGFVSDFKNNQPWNENKPWDTPFKYTINFESERSKTARISTAKGGIWTHEVVNFTPFERGSGQKSSISIQVLPEIYKLRVKFEGTTDFITWEYPNNYKEKAACDYNWKFILWGGFDITRLIWDADYTIDIFKYS